MSPLEPCNCAWCVSLRSGAAVEVTLHQTPIPACFVCGKCRCGATPCPAPCRCVEAREKAIAALQAYLAAGSKEARREASVLAKDALASFGVGP